MILNPSRKNWGYVCAASDGRAKAMADLLILYTVVLQVPVNVRSGPRVKG